MLGRVKHIVKSWPVIGPALRWANRKRVDWLTRVRARNHYVPWLNQRLLERHSLYPLPTQTPPRFDILTVSYETDPAVLQATANSILNQDYPHWRWIIFDNGSRKPATQELLAALAADPRVKLVRNPSNLGITAGHRAALEHCDAEYVVLVDHDDLLTHDALRIVAWHIDQADRPAYLYSDEDKCGADERRFSPMMKPDVSPLLILDTMYCCHLSVIRRDALRRCGAFTNQSVEGTQDWDMAVRLFESGETIVHIPEVLYTWRSTPQSTSMQGIAAKPYVIAAQRHCLESALQRRGLASRFEVRSNPLFQLPDGHWHIARKQTPVAPQIDVVLPAGDSVEDLSAVLIGLLQNTDYPNYRVRVVGTLGAATLENLRSTVTQIAGDLPPHVSFQAGPAGALNVPRLWNQILQQRPAGEPLGEYVAWVPGGTRNLTRDWLWEAIGTFELGDRVGLVGGRYFDAQDCLIGGPGVCGLSGMIDVAYRGAHRNHPGTDGIPFCRREVACILRAPWVARTAVLQGLNGFDERFPRILFEGDMGIRLNRAGWSVVSNPFISGYGKSIAGLDDLVQAEIPLLYELHFDWLRNDRYYGPYFSLDRNRMYEIVEPAERAGYLNARLCHLQASRGDDKQILAVPASTYEPPQPRMKRTVA